MTAPAIDIDELERLRAEIGEARGVKNLIHAEARYMQKLRDAENELFRLARLAATQADEIAALRAKYLCPIGAENGSNTCSAGSCPECVGERLDAEIAALRAERDEAITWRCFHCDEVFIGRESASAHFGYSECSDPACRVDGGLAAAYRELEARWSRCTSECCEHANAYHAKEAERRAALVREEQRGYDKGVSDMSAALASARALLVRAGEALDFHAPHWRVHSSADRILATDIADELHPRLGHPATTPTAEWSDLGEIERVEIEDLGEFRRHRTEETGE